MSLMDLVKARRGQGDMGKILMGIALTGFLIYIVVGNFFVNIQTIASSLPTSVQTAINGSLSTVVGSTTLYFVAGLVVVAAFMKRLID